jgi:hypothetical protein
MMMHHKKRYLFTYYIVLGLFLLQVSCKKDNNAVDPPANVNITINPNTTEYQELNTVGGWMYLPLNLIPPQSRGIIVYRITQNEFMAYDRTPPYEPDQCCTVDACTALIVSMPFVNDTCTGSQYQILDGVPIDGPSNIPLIRYTTYYDGLVLQIIS